MIDYEKLNEMISSVRGTTFAGITTKTQVKLTGGKKNPMQGRVEKLTEDANIIVYSNSEVSGYGAMVKRRMLKEGKDPAEFVMKPRAWGTRVGKSPFIEHNGKYYLECIFRSPGKTTYFLDGKPINKEDIEGLPEAKEKTEEKTEAQEKSQGGIEDKIIIRTFALDSIVSVKLKNEVFTDAD
jgi:hypothetical protein